MNLFKLTDSKNQTYNKTQWGENITHSIPTKMQGKVMCSSEVIHAYKNLNLGLLLNPIHGNFIDCKLWKSKGKVVTEDLEKVGCWKLTTLKQLDLPDWYTNKQTQKRVQVRFAILCAEKVLKYFEEVCPNDKRPREAIQAAQDYLKGTKTEKQVHAAAYAAKAANNVANNVAYAASSAAYAAASAAADVDDAAAEAARAVDDAAYAVTCAACAARIDAELIINFSSLADKAVSIENRS